MDINIVIGGEAGQGLKTMSIILGKTLFKAGYHIFSSQDYMSRVRGGHNFIKIRISDREVNGPADRIDILVALKQEAIANHHANLKDKGVVVSETDKEDLKNKLIKKPAEEIAREINIKALNIIFVGAVLKLLGLEKEICQEVVADYFDKESIVKDNIKLLAKGYEFTETLKDVETNLSAREEIYLDGNTAIGLGALAGGVKFYAAYPMSPSTSIMNYIADRQQETGVVVEQAEDEIAAINMALGASYGGLRSMTGTSGGGFSLMAEAFGLAGITETPLVIALVQRPGPATGLPTRTEQGDLQFVIHASQGEFPLMVIALRDQEDAFYQTVRALNLADKYQIPVVILSDQFLADSAKNVKEFSYDQIEVNRHLAELKKDDEYKRYKITTDGISPRIYPGQVEGQTVLVDSDEHDEEGHIIEDAETRKAMVDKRSRKLEKLIEEDLQQPEYVGQEDVDYLILAYGSTCGPVQEAVELLTESGIKAGGLMFYDVWPLPQKELEKWAEQKPKLITVEINSTAQLAGLIQGETMIKINDSILKYDGRPFSGQEIYHRLKDEVIDNG